MLVSTYAHTSVFLYIDILCIGFHIRVRACTDSLNVDLDSPASNLNVVEIWECQVLTVTGILSEVLRNGKRENKTHSMLGGSGLKWRCLDDVTQEHEDPTCFLTSV